MIASAQPAEVNLAEAALATVKVPSAKGRPRTRPKEAVANKGYDRGLLRRRLRRRGIKPGIPERWGKQAVRSRKANLSGYRQRWKVERTLAWLGNYHRLVVQYEWLAHIYWAFVLLAFILICLERILQ